MTSTSVRQAMELVVCRSTQANLLVCRYRLQIEPFVVTLPAGASSVQRLSDPPRVPVDQRAWPKGLTECRAWSRRLLRAVVRDAV